MRQEGKIQQINKNMMTRGGDCTEFYYIAKRDSFMGLLCYRAKQKLYKEQYSRTF